MACYAAVISGRRTMYRSRGRSTIHGKYLQSIIYSHSPTSTRLRYFELHPSHRSLFTNHCSGKEQSNDKSISQSIGKGTQMQTDRTNFNHITSHSSFFLEWSTACLLTQHLHSRHGLNRERSAWTLARVSIFCSQDGLVFRSQYNWTGSCTAKSVKEVG